MQSDVLSPLDGRYQAVLAPLRAVCGAAAFARARVRAEAAWLLVLNTLHLPGFAPLSAREKALLEQLPQLSEKDLQILYQ